MLNMQANLDQIDQVVLALEEYTQTLPCIFLLQGDLASGKTTLIQHYCKVLNAPLATSPTFTLLHVYQSPTLCIYHYDFYLKEVEELFTLGILEKLEQKGVHFIEWGGEALYSLLRSFGFDPFILSLKRTQHTCHYKLRHG